MLQNKIFVLDKALSRIQAVRTIRGSTSTIWAASSLFLFIDTFIYSLTVANLPDILQDKMDTSESSNGAVTAMFGVGAILGGSFVMLLSDRLRLRRPFQLLGSVFYIVAGVIFYFAKRFYHMILFRLVNGVASGIACTLLYTAVGDVYPASLLGFKVAIVYFCNNISYTIGPICGEKLFDKSGIPAIASVVIALGVLEFALVFTVVEDSLVLRNFLQRSSQTLPDSLLRASETDTYSLHMIDASTSNKSTPNISGNNIDEACFTRLENSNSMTITPTDKRQPHEQPPPQTEETIAKASSNAKANPQSVTLWRLLLNVHVLVPTISIIVSIGIQCMLEAVVPLHLDDAFDMSSRSGITFVIYGLALTILVPVIGKINDLIIEYRGSHMRYYLMLFGSVTSILTITLLALAKSYGLMMFGYVLYAITNLCMCIPAQSAYGDFANYLDSNSMAFSYGVATIAWAVGAIAFPPIIATAFGIGGLLGGLFVGYISDRTQNRIIPQASAALLYIVSGCILYFADKFYQVVIFRIILGIASSVADTMLFTTVADVYPANLLGLKMSVLFVFDNVGNMLGPWLGGKAYGRMGIQGISVISMGLGAAEFIMILVFVPNSLDIRKSVSGFVTSQAAEDGHRDTRETQVQTSYCPSSNTSTGNLDLSKGFSESSSIYSLKTESVRDKPCTATTTTTTTATVSTKSNSTESIGMTDDGSEKKPASTHIWKLILQLPVIGPAVTIFVATGMQSVVETTIPLRLYDKFGYSPETIGIAFLIVGGVLIVAMPLVGYINDTVITKYGENMRYYTIAFGMVAILVSLLITGVASTYAVLIFGYALFAITAMVAIVPAQSAFGDFINSSDSEAMAQCYSLAWIAEGLANISLPPLSSGLYDAIGFLSMLMSLGSALCAFCVLAVLAFPLKMFWDFRKQAVA
ncbi:hypothetical protein H4217_000243 [Coemansia sp. RSA 1939]|nr:hypothetical protein H4217_000243 [Coemansia sp. RSA 1939]